MQRKKTESTPPNAPGRIRRRSPLRTVLVGTVTYSTVLPAAAASVLPGACPGSSASRLVVGISSARVCEKA